LQKLSASGATGVDKRGQILHFLTGVKFRGAVGKKYLSEFHGLLSMIVTGVSY